MLMLMLFFVDAAVSCLLSVIVVVVVVFVLLFDNPDPVLQWPKSAYPGHAVQCPGSSGS